MKRYKQEELHQDNEKLYQMLKTAPSSYPQKDISEHTERFYRMKQNINTNHRRRHQNMVAHKIVNLKEQTLGISTSNK